MKQGDAVRQAIMQVLESKGINYELGGPEKVSKYEDLFLAEVKTIIFNGFKDETIDMSAEAKEKYLTDDKKLTTYVASLISNWVRKDTGFNCGVPHEIKNPGSRSGMSDPTVKNLKAAMTLVTDPEKRKVIQEALDKRLAELKPKATVQVDLNALPDHIRELIEG